MSPSTTWEGPITRFWRGMGHLPAFSLVPGQRNAAAITTASSSLVDSELDCPASKDPGFGFMFGASPFHLWRRYLAFPNHCDFMWQDCHLGVYLIAAALCRVVRLHVFEVWYQKPHHCWIKQNITECVLQSDLNFTSAVLCIFLWTSASTSTKTNKTASALLLRFVIRHDP